MSLSIALRVTGSSSLEVDSCLADAVAENALPIPGPFAQFGVPPRALFPLPEELVGNVERGEDREFRRSAGRQALSKLAHLAVDVGGDHLDVVGVGASNLVLAAENR